MCCLLKNCLLLGERDPASSGKPLDTDRKRDMSSTRVESCHVLSPSTPMLLARSFLFVCSQLFYLFEFSRYPLDMDNSTTVERALVSTLGESGTRSLLLPPFATVSHHQCVYHLVCLFVQFLFLFVLLQ